MAKYPYILKTGSIKKFIDKIPSVGTPDKVTQKFLHTLNFKSTNDRSIIPVLRFLKFLDDAGVPTERYKQYRNKSKSAQILGASVKEAYSELFKIYPDADKKDHQTLQNFFSTKTGLGERAVKSIVETFKALCSLAKFNEVIDSETFVDSVEDSPAFQNPSTKSTLNNLDLALARGRKARIIVPQDITQKELEKLKNMLDLLFTPSEE